jgi:hypothetical protein
VYSCIVPQPVVMAITVDPRGERLQRFVRKLLAA